MNQPIILKRHGACYLQTKLYRSIKVSKLNLKLNIWNTLETKGFRLSITKHMKCDFGNKKLIYGIVKVDEYETLWLKSILNLLFNKILG